MAVLATADRQRVWRAFMRWLSRNLAGIPNVTKSDLQAAVDATDTWIDTNQSSFNSALPATFRNNATLVQKTLLFCAVAAMRVSAGALRDLLGEEVD